MSDRRWYRMRALRMRERLHLTGGEPETCSLVGEAFFDLPPHVELAGSQREVAVVTLAIFRWHPADSLDDQNTESIVGNMFVGEDDTVPSLVSASVDVHVSPAAFEQLARQSAVGSEFWLDVAFNAAAESTTASTELPKRLSVSSITTQPSGTTPPSWRANRLSTQLRAVLQDLHYDSRWSQVGRICEELVAGLVEIENSQQRVERLQGIRTLIHELRTAFCSPIEETDSEHYDTAYGLTRGGFDRHISKFDDKRQTELRHRFDRLWTHYSVVSLVQRGEADYGPAKDGLKHVVDELDAAAARYMNLDGLRSPTLERVLLDALVFAECSAFAKHSLTGTSVLGLSLAGPLKAKGPWNVLGQGLKKAVLDGLAEAVKLALSFAVAWTITGGEPTAAWVVMTGYTMWRWLRRLHLLRELQPNLKATELLQKMTWVSESVGKQDFNAAGVRHLVRALSLEGVVFSPWVLNILDRQAKA